MEDADRGVQVFRVASPCLGQTCRVDVLLPNEIKASRTYRTLYVLTVGGEWAANPPWGNGLTELHKLDAHNRYRLICVSMDFDTVAWYGSHATNPRIRHDEHLIAVVVPLVEERYPVSRRPSDRLLIGFSKSGWGAVSLLLRHPEFFGSACSWDAPMMLDETSLRWGSQEHFGTAEQAAAYAPAHLVGKQAEHFVGKPVRLAIVGHDYFGQDVGRFHDLLETHRVPHRFDNSLRHKHGWESGWLPKALAIMLGARLPEE
ncbi:MAG: alpha/beta hydrolase-fold protein [Candidatus Latescibacterota bacterium]